MTTAIKQMFFDLVYFPNWGRGVLCVWRRNFLFFRYTLFTTLTLIFLEPLLYLFALGYGLGRLVSDIDGQSYAHFIAPAMMATSGMFISFFEGTYSTFTKLTRQNTYQTIILTPISPDEVVMGELLWVTTKGFLSVVSVAIVLCLMGLMPVMHLPSVLAVMLLMCWVFASMGIWLSSLAKSYELFSYGQSVFITPMSLFCGTYFPLEHLPLFLKGLAYTLPLTHGLMAVRMILTGEFKSTIFINIIYLVLMAVFFSNLAAARFVRKLVS